MTSMRERWRGTSAAICRAIRRSVAKNVPGAGGLTLANYMYNRAPADGSEFATVQNGLPFEKLFQMLSPGGKQRAVRRDEIRLDRQHHTDRVRHRDLAQLAR